MSKCDIEIQFDRSDRTCAGGGVVSGEVMVRVNQGISCDGTVLRDDWGTHGKGTRRTGTKHELQLCHSHPLQADTSPGPALRRADCPMSGRRHFQCSYRVRPGLAITVMV